MKRILILGRRNAGEKNDARLLAEAIGRHAEVAAVHGAYFEDVVIETEKGSNQAFIHSGGIVENLGSYQVVILINWSFHRLYTDLAHSLALIASRSGVEVWNSELINARSASKVSQMVRLSYEDVAIPRTYFSLTPSLLEGYSDTLGSPFIAKDPLASRGRSNHLCRDWKELSQRLEPGVSYLLQEFIPNDASDLRMFVARGEPVLGIVRRGSGETHLTNVSQGAAAELVDLKTLPESLIEATKRIAAHFNRELCGIDFMKNTETGEYVFLEINTTPQIVNGVFVEEKASALAQILTRK
ncbi:MAG TPA: hypothetical protein VJ841_00670 [Candidatus Saccharimonadales bacterium]|nr:hypothetical protein [Candidatus Saccharimonadales bacterium]